MAQFDCESDDRELMAFLHDVADAAADTLDEVRDWSLSGEREGQYLADVVVDDVIVDMLEAAGIDVLSEESGATAFEWPITGNGLVAIVDPLDGSTNASKGLPWFATSICIVDRDGPRLALVAEQSGSETRFAAIRGAGANCDGVPLRVTALTDPSRAVVGTNGAPSRDHEWWQTRTLGAAALDISLVAKGGLDGYIDFHDHGVWDYAAALLICREAGAVIGEVHGRELMVADASQRRSPVVACSRQIYDSLLDAARRR